MKITVQEIRSVSEGSTVNPSAIEIKTDKGLMSSCNQICHVLHQQGSKPKSKGLSRYFVVLVDGKETALKFGDDCQALKVNDKFVKEAGMKAVSLKDFTQDFVLFSTAMLPTLSSVIRYFLTPYIPEEIRGEEYKVGAKKFFKVDVKEKKDAVSFASQASSMIEKTIYLTQDLVSSAKEENMDEYLRNKRESARLAIEQAKEARKLLAK
jgi:hypothetical protein